MRVHFNRDQVSRRLGRARGLSSKTTLRAARRLEDDVVEYMSIGQSVLGKPLTASTCAHLLKHGTAYYQPDNANRTCSFVWCGGRLSIIDEPKENTAVVEAAEGSA